LCVFPLKDKDGLMEGPNNDGRQQRAHPHWDGEAPPQERMVFIAHAC
jgi:hypothetical protein